MHERGELRADTQMAMVGRVAASTQNQALSALPFLYREVLEVALPWLAVCLLYSTGMRLLEGLRLRVKDVDFERREITVRDGKGAKDRRTMLSERLLEPLRTHLAKGRALHEQDLAGGFGDVHRLRSAARFSASAATRG